MRMLQVLSHYRLLPSVGHNGAAVLWPGAAGQAGTTCSLKGPFCHRSACHGYNTAPISQAARGRMTVLLDGDNIRHGLNKNLGFRWGGL